MTPTHPALRATDHRPWPVPTGPWTWRQSWRDLAFLHWPVPASVLRPLVPRGLTVQEFDGTSWVGVVPFRMAGVMRRPLPDLPGVSAFPELNVRLYVEAGGKPGVWFLSLDASQRVVVWAARRFFHLPYHLADMAVERDGDAVGFTSQRRGGGQTFSARYAPTAGAGTAAPGTLEHWLTERYCLYAGAPDGTLLRTEVHHAPWPLRRAEVEIEANSMLDAHGLAQASPPPLVHVAARVDVVVWDAVAVDAA